jgi:hypothetical protein
LNLYTDLSFLKVFSSFFKRSISYIFSASRSETLLSSLSTFSLMAFN